MKKPIKSYSKNEKSTLLNCYVDKELPRQHVAKCSCKQRTNAYLAI